jgi:CspA family cold shock protein
LEAAQERPRRGRAKIISAWAFYYLAENLVKLGRYDEAERFLRKGQKLIWAVSSPQLTKLYNSLRQNLKEEVLTGRIYTVNEHRGYGLIERDDNPSESVFLHISYISPGVTNQEFKMLEGKHVQFQIKQTEKGPQAINVQLITNAFESS